MNEPRDDGPDPRLRAALRHAPDADRHAPPQLRSTLLAAARDAVAPKAPWWQRWLPTLPRHLGASGAFASLLLAGVIGLLWRGETPPAVDESRGVAKTESLPAPAPASPVAPSTPVVATAPAEMPVAARPAPARKVDADMQRAQHLAEQQRAQQAQRHAEAAAQRERAEVQARAAQATVPPPAVTEAPAAFAKAAPAAPAVVAPAPPPPPAAPAPAAAPQAQAARTLSLPQAGNAERRSAKLAANAADATSPAPTRADEAWLQRVEQVPALQWTPAPPPTTLTGLRHVVVDGARPAQLWLASAQVWWCDANGAACRSAPLDAETASRLLAALPRDR